MLMKIVYANRLGVKHIYNLTEKHCFNHVSSFYFIGNIFIFSESQYLINFCIQFHVSENQHSQRILILLPEVLKANVFLLY